MIIGIGVDVVDIARFERSALRTPALLDRLFADRERMTGARVLPMHSLAARFAAKEALIKAFGDSTGFQWHDMEVVSDAHGNPSFALHNDVARRATMLGIARVHLSMSHDAGVAIAYVIAEGGAS